MNKKIIFVLLGLLSLGLTSCGTVMDVYPDADKYIAGNKEYTDLEVSKIDIDWISGSITLVEDENATGIIIEEVTTLTDEKALVHSYYHDGILNIKYFASGYWCKQYNYKKELTITYKPGLDELIVDLTSGSLVAENIHAKNINLDFTSGSMNIGNIVADDVDVDMTSGNATFINVNAKNFDVDMTSGTINIGYEAIEKSRYSLTSGKINMTLPSDGATIKVNKTSGSVTTNRECTVDKNTYKFGEGTAEITVSMTSGSLTIS